MPPPVREARFPVTAESRNTRSAFATCTPPPWPATFPLRTVRPSRTTRIELGATPITSKMSVDLLGVDEGKSRPRSLDRHRARDVEVAGGIPILPRPGQIDLVDPGRQDDRVGSCQRIGRGDCLAEKRWPSPGVTSSSVVFTVNVAGAVRPSRDSSRRRKRCLLRVMRCRRGRRERDQLPSNAPISTTATPLKLPSFLRGEAALVGGRDAGVVAGVDGPAAGQ